MCSSDLIPWRRAYATDPFPHSVPGQLPSLLMAGGGRPCRVVPCPGREDVWVVGIDSSRRADHQIVAMTLVSPSGELCGAWTIRQRRDETVAPASQRLLVKACEARLNEVAGASVPVLCLRDGRVFENEDERTYIDGLGGQVSLVECRKSAVPQVIRTGETWADSGGPAVFQLPQTNTLFVATAAPRLDADLASPLKVSWSTKTNRLGLTATEISRLLIAHAAAPGLGTEAHHLPSALYWADGISGASDTDLRFRGQQVVRLG